VRLLVLSIGNEESIALERLSTHPLENLFGRLPSEIVDGGNRRVPADDGEQSWAVIDESPRMEERTAVDSKIQKEVRERPELDLEKPLRIRLPRRSP
jgi:hypothetical protein